MVMSLAAFPLAAFGFSGSELFIVLLIVLVLFGGAKLPSLARGLGQAIREFKKASNEDTETKPAATADAAKPVEAKKPGEGVSNHGAN
jgi:sec-independent protein translocase protein TatA